MPRFAFCLALTLVAQLLSSRAFALETSPSPNNQGSSWLAAGAVAGAGLALGGATWLHSHLERQHDRARILQQSTAMADRPVTEGVLRKISLNVNEGENGPTRMREIGQYLVKQGAHVALLQEAGEDAGKQIQKAMGPGYTRFHVSLPKAPGSAELEPTRLTAIYDDRELELVGHVVVGLPKLKELVGLENSVMRDGTIEQRYSVHTFFRDRRTGEIHEEINAHLDAAGDAAIGASERGTTHRTVQAYAIKQAALDLQKHGRAMNVDPRLRHAVELGPAVEPEQLGVGARKAWHGFKPIPALYDGEPTYTILSADLSRLDRVPDHRTVYMDTNAAEARRRKAKDITSPAKAQGIDRVMMPLQELAITDPSTEPTHDFRQGHDPGKAHRLGRRLGTVPALRAAVSRGLGVEIRDKMDVLATSDTQTVVARLTSPIPGPRVAAGGREVSDHRLSTVDVLRKGFTLADGKIVGEFERRLPNADAAALRRTGQWLVLDMDKTIVDGNSMEPFAQQAIKSGLIKVSDAARLAKMAKSYGGKAGGETSEGIHGLMTLVGKLLEGKTVGDLDDVAKRARMPAIFPRMRELISVHVREGGKVMIASASPTPMVRKVAEDLGLSEAAGHVFLGTELKTEVQGGRSVYTGEVAKYLHGEEKGREVLHQLQVRNVPPEHVTAMSDSHFDQWMDVFARKYAVNPDPALREHATNASWRVLQAKPVGGSVIAHAARAGRWGAALGAGVVREVRDRRQARAQQARPTAVVRMPRIVPGAVPAVP